MKLFGIEKQILLVALIPILVMAVLLESYLVYSRISDQESALLERSHMLVRQLASSSEYAVFSGNTALLQQHVDAALTQQDVSRVVVLDASAKPLAGGGNEERGSYETLLAKATMATPVYQDEDALILYEPVVATQIKLNDLDRESGLTPAVTSARSLGAVIIEISRHRLINKKHEISLLSLVITLLVLMLALMLALWAARRITRPIMEMSQSIHSFGAGNLDARVLQRVKVPELNKLSAGFNEMASKLQHQQEILEARVAERTLALAASEQESRTILENTPDTIARYASDLRRIYVNPAFGALADGGVDTLLGTKPSENPGGPNFKLYETKIKEVFASGENAQFELKWPGKNGVAIYSHIRLIAERDLSGNVTSVLGVGRDITGLKLAEQQLEERGAEAIRLRDEAMAASQAKSEFLANMSHEIRTPMNSILGMAHLALNTEISPKGRNYLEKVRLSGLHLLGIIEEILDFSKISAGKLEIEKIDFDLGDVLENVKSLLNERVREKGLIFVINIDPSLPPCLRGDPLRLGQVLINYAGNAVKFTETGGIIVRARKMDENASGVLVRFEVQDTGIGIGDAEKSLLFQPFQQADSSTTREYGGTGLGLAISKQLVELMEEGKVGVESLAGEGSTFWFSVRLGIGRLPQAVAPVSATDAPSGKPAILNGARILLADDHPLNREVATGMLEHAGAVVSLARNGQEALDLLGQQCFDCVLLDVQMPVMDGYETARLIRANPAWAGMPVIAMTASASKRDRECCLAAGMDDFISKPFNPATFYATLAQWLAGPAQPTPFPATPATLPGTANWGGDPDIIDLSVLAGWNGGNKLKMREFVLKFLALARQDMAEIDTALDHGNLEALGTLGHHNRSPARMVGAMGFAKLCQALEALSESKGSMEQARDIVSQMHPLLDRISEQVDKELA